MLEYFNTLFACDPEMALFAIGFALGTGFIAAKLYVDFLEWLLDKVFKFLDRLIKRKKQTPVQ